MLNRKITRRGFLAGCSTAIAALAGSQLTSLAFASPDAENESREIIMAIFLRGGADGLSIVPPLAGPDRGYYEMARPQLQIPTSGANALIPLDDRFGLHPFAAPLHDLYQDGKLAIIHAAGLTSDTRSHFDAMAFMELGTPGQKRTPTGWLTRHLLTAGNLPPEIIIPVLAAGGNQPDSLLGSRETIAMSSPNEFSLIADWQYRNQLRSSLRHLYAGDSWLPQVGQETLDAMDIIENANPDDYVPAHGAAYPDGDFGDNLQIIAQMIKLNLGLRVATVDLGGWDTHERQAWDVTGYFADMVAELAQGLHAFHTDLDSGGADNPATRLTVVVMSEFGRRVRENAARGTDHGHGNIILVLGGKVNGGRVYGDWPGMSADQLYQGADLAITTDYRRVLSEILIRRLKNPNLGVIFPNYRDYAPLGVIQGEDIPPVYDDAVRTFLPFISR